MVHTKIHVLLLGTLLASPVFGLTFIGPVNGNGNFLGKTNVHIVKQGESLLDIGHHYDIGVLELRKANPGLNNRRLKAGVHLKIPSRYQLPSGPRNGIVLNLAEMRVYYYHPDSNEISTYPVGVGKQGWSTPIGTSTIVRKVPNPTWTPPPSIVREAERRGKHLRPIGPGPKNPLGHYAMYLGFPRILMHGTTAPSSIGLRSSHGCIRMFNKDIKELFHHVPVGTQVRIVYEPRK